MIADTAAAAVHVHGKEGITSYYADRIFPAEVTQEEIYAGGVPDGHFTEVVWFVELCVVVIWGMT